MLRNKISTMKSIFLISLIVIFISNVRAQSIFEPLGARNISLANTSTTIADIWSALHNPAGIAAIDHLTTAVHFQNKYGLVGFNSMAVVAGSPVPSGAVAIGVHRFGDKLYNEHRISAAYASEIGIIKIGGRASYLQYSVQDFSTRASYSVDFGVMTSLTKTLTIGANAYNITQASISDSELGNVPTILMLGLQFKPLPIFFLNAEVEKNISLPAFAKLGMEYNLADNFFLRTGVRSDTFESYYGIALKFFSMQIDYALSLHQELGVSNAISLQYVFDKK